MTEQSHGALDFARLRSTGALTLVGANERNGTTQLLLNSVLNPSCAFPGTISVVSRSAESVYGIPAVADVRDLTGDLGVGWLMTGPDGTLDVLEKAGGRFDAVVVFGGGYAEVGNTQGEEQLRDWAARTGVPVFGPQSVGFGFFSARRNFLDIMWKHPIKPGPVGIVAHSGGILTALCGAMTSRGPGAAAAFALGNEAVQDAAGLIGGLLEDDEVETVVGYLEHFRSIQRFASVAARAAELGKPLVLLVGGRTEVGSSMAASHTGALATPYQLVKGVAEQFGVVLVDSLDEIVDSVNVLLRNGRRRFGRGRVGYFSNTQGLNVILADALSTKGMLPTPLATETRAALPGRPPAPGNPYDAGAGKLARPEEFVAQVATFVGDPGIDIVCHQIHQQATVDQATHLRRHNDFNRVAREAGKPVVVGFATDEADLRDDVEAGVTVAGGQPRAVAMVRALSAWSAPTPPFLPPNPTTVAQGPTVVLTGAEARSALASVPLDWPDEIRVGLDEDIEAALSRVRHPVVLKAETGDAHRAAVGAVLVGLPDLESAAAGIVYLRSRFAGAIAVIHHVPHDAEYFLGLSRAEDGTPLLIVDRGGRELGSRTVLRVLPLTDEQGIDVVSEVIPGLDVGYLAELVPALLALLHEETVEAVDLNPVVVIGGRLTVLDGKVHRVRREERR
ncbi:hypothetical protein ACQPXT_34350 [Streptomyces sp. CA-100214]